VGRVFLLQMKVTANNETQPQAKRLLWEQCYFGKHLQKFIKFLSLNLSFCVTRVYKSTLPIALVAITLALSQMGSERILFPR